MSGRSDFSRPILLGRTELLRELAAVATGVTRRRDLDALITDTFVVDLDELSAVIAEACESEHAERHDAAAATDLGRTPRFLRRRA